MADNRAARHHGDPSLSTVRSAHVSRVHVLADDVSRLQHVSNPDVHPVRVQDAQNPRRLQRGQVHRLHHVLYMHRLARFCTHLFRH